MDKNCLDKSPESNTIVYTISWSSTKSSRLKRVRGVSFEEVLSGKFLGIEDHPSRNDQRILAIEYKGYVWALPFVPEKGGIFLKILYPSRKFKKMYRKRRHYEKD